MRTIKKLIFILAFLNLPVVSDDSPDTFDIMFVYTTAAKNMTGKKQLLKNINTTISYINQSFINSNIPIKFKLVHTAEISYPQDYIGLNDGDKFRLTLDRLIDTNDGYMDDVHNLRDKYSADMVQLLVANKAYGGLAPPYLYGPHAFGVIAEPDRIAGFRANSVHEFGHSMGMQHNIESSGGQQGSFPYSYGYRSPNGYFRTIMSYPGNGCPNPCKRVNYWANPNIYYNNEPMGIAGESDAKSTIMNNAHTIANFRRRPQQHPPTLTTTPPSLTPSNSVSIEINGEEGYEIYINGIYRGILNGSGKKTVTLNLLSLHNHFTITLKHAPSATVSNALIFNIIKKIDTDNDGIYDHIEELLGLNPNSVDSDGDGYTDLEEVGNISNPKDTDFDGIIDALDEDSDNDGVSDKDERLANIIVNTIIVPYILYETI